MDAEQNNFEVIVDGSKCKLTGHLTDSTNLNLYKESFSKIEEISMAELYSISWLGLQRLYELLEKMDKNVLLTDILPHVYRTILLLLKHDDKIAV